MRLALARVYGDPAYWLDPDLPDELIATAVMVATEKPKRKRPTR